MRLTELITRRDVSDALVQIEVLEPGRFADVEMIDRMQVVVEARQRDLARAQSAAIGQPTIDQQDVEAGARQIAAEDQSVVPGADDNAVVGFFDCLGQRPFPRRTCIDCRLANYTAGRPAQRSMATGAWPTSRNCWPFQRCSILRR